MTSSNDPDQIRREIEQTRADLSSNVGILEEKVTPSRVVDRRVRRARGTASKLRDRVMGAAQHAGGASHGAGGSGLDSARSAVSSAGDSVSSAPSAVTDRAQGNPIAAGLIAFGVGWLAASVFAPTAGEQQLASQLKDKAQPTLTDTAKQVAGDLKEPAAQAANEVKDAATSASTQVTDQAKSSVGEVKGQAGSAAGDIKNTTTS